jgi:amino acid permease
MFLMVRGLFFVALIGVAISLLLYVISGQPRYKLHALRVLKWTVYAALVFFGGLIVQRLM